MTRGKTGFRSGLADPHSWHALGPCHYTLTKHFLSDQWSNFLKRLSSHDV